MKRHHGPSMEFSSRKRQAPGTRHEKVGWPSLLRKRVVAPGEKPLGPGDRERLAAVSQRQLLAGRQAGATRRKGQS